MSSRKAKLAVRSSSMASRWLRLTSTSRPRVRGRSVSQVEVADGLGIAVDLEDEVVLGEVLDEGAFFIVDDDRDVDQACIYVECGSGGGGGLPGCGGRLGLSGGAGRLRQQRRGIGCG